MLSLHSNLVLFKCLIEIQSLLVHLCFTFQSGSIQMESYNEYVENFLNFTFQSGSIQITVAPFTVLFISIFTFQSGSIQIFLCSKLLNFVPAFTFQSGSIQIDRCANQRLWGRTLHSNLVLFKFANIYHYSTSFRTLHSNLVLFKFKHIFIKLFVSIFTFQSGSIQIGYR